MLDRTFAARRLPAGSADRWRLTHPESSGRGGPFARVPDPDSGPPRDPAIVYRLARRNLNTDGDARDQVQPVMGPIESEGFAEVARAAAELLVADRPGQSGAWARAIGSHGFDAVDRLQSTEEDRDGLIWLAADDVGAVVHAVGEVDIEGAGLGVHGLVAWRPPSSEGVRGAIVDAEVGLGLDDGGAENFARIERADKRRAEQGAGEGHGIAREEAACRGARHGGIVGEETTGSEETAQNAARRREVQELNAKIAEVRRKAMRRSE